MMLTHLRERMTILFLAFFLLVSFAVVATSWATETQQKDALVINLAGRQRMLIQQMTKEALQIARDRGGDHLSALQEAAHIFDQTLWALIRGGQAPYLPDRTVDVPATQHGHILASLHQVHQAWDTFRGHLDVVMTAIPGSQDFAAAIQAVEQQSPGLVQQADDVVRMYEAASAGKIARLRWIQLTFFISALALLAVGSRVMQMSVLRPLRALGSAAQRMGQGDLNTPVEVTGPSEIQILADTFDTMRAQLRASREKLLAWTEELDARVAQRTQELAALYEVSREISSRLDIEHVLRSVTDKARELLGGEVAVLCLLDEDRQALILGALSGPPEALCQVRVATHNSLAVQVLAADRALSCGADGCVAGPCGILRAPFRISHLVAPLRVGERAIGALCVGSPEADAFSGEGTSLLTRLANSAAIALENARLYQQAERVAALEERQHIAAEMHDGLAQTLSYLGLKAERVAELVGAGRGEEASQELHRMRDVIGQVSQEIRGTIASLQDGPQPRQTLQDRLAEVVDGCATNGAPPVDLVMKLAAPLLLPPDESEQVLRVVREALLNACRHAGADHITVRLEQRGPEAVVIVEDDGRGFDPKVPPANGDGHFGLSIMRARAARIGGRFTVHSAPGQGTRVILTWPLESVGAGLAPAQGPAPVQGACTWPGHPQGVPLS